MSHEVISQPDVVSRAGPVLGIVQRVDPVLRELSVLTANGLKVVDIPVDCPVFLHGERIKLRLVQPRDHVKLKLARHELENRDALMTASFVEVQPDAGFSCFRL
jgi:hypothetical protein